MLNAVSPRRSPLSRCIIFRFPFNLIAEPMKRKKKEKYNFSTIIFSFPLNITLSMVHIYQFEYAAVMGYAFVYVISFINFPTNQIIWKEKGEIKIIVS